MKKVPRILNVLYGFIESSRKQRYDIRYNILDVFHQANLCRHKLILQSFFLRTPNLK